ncbi:hypothetical protein [Halorhabdus amylolytica]|uniref:hypothetical protein n=1 Tax=Halorhabdus amylolytica TaxID=2559573 RepID=UPI0010A9E26B|nr:hypothetical protein [Halorhabdus amylolytica]
MDRTTLAKVLLVVAIAIPVVIEGVTFFGLFGQHFGGAEDATTPTPDALSVGDNLLAGVDEANVTATIESGSIQTTADGWLFTLQIAVTNHGSDTSVVTFGPVTTGGGTTRKETVTSDRLSPNTTDSVVAQWSLPSGETPRALDVVVRADGVNSPTVERTVRIGGFAVQR